MNVVIERDNTSHKNKSRTLTEQVDEIKNTLYRKIDVCFMKYGLRGLKKIDESIADGLKCFIAEEEGIAPNTLGSSSNKQSVRNENYYDDPMMLAGEMDDSYETQPIDDGMSHSTSQVSENAQSQYTDPAFALAAEMDAPDAAAQSDMNENTNNGDNQNVKTNL